MMKKFMTIFMLVIIGVVSSNITQAQSLGTVFTYQGKLSDGGSPANGVYDLQFRLFDSAFGNIQVGDTITQENINVYTGHFKVKLDFGDGKFEGDSRWLQIGVRLGTLADPNIYTELTSRQELTPSPYALYAAHAGSDSDWIVTPPNMRSGVNGNVGIGVIIPNYKLDVAGTIKGTSGHFGTDQLVFGADLQAANTIYIMDHSTDSPNLFIGDNDGQFLQLRWDSLGDYAQLVTPSTYHISFMPGGNVGIATYEPEETLDVRGNLELDQKILAHDAGGLELATDEGTTRLFIADDGNVGIGTYTPDERFEVVGGLAESLDQENLSWNDDTGGGWQSFTVGKNGKLTRVAMYGGGGLVDPWTVNIYLGEGTSGTLLFTDSVSPSSYDCHSVKISPAIDVQVGEIYTIQVLVGGGGNWKYSMTNPYAQGRSSLDAGYDFTFQTYVSDSATALQASADGDVYLAHNDGGRVGIGTNSPSYKLDVDGDVQAHAYHTGDIFFQKEGRKLWRMFEDEDGLYVENLLTGKVYDFVLRERNKAVNTDRLTNLEKTIHELQAEVKALNTQIQIKK